VAGRLLGGACWGETNIDRIQQRRKTIPIETRVAIEARKRSGHAGDEGLLVGSRGKAEITRNGLLTDKDLGARIEGTRGEGTPTDSADRKGGKTRAKKRAKTEDRQSGVFSGHLKGPVFANSQSHQERHRSGGQPFESRRQEAFTKMSKVCGGSVLKSDSGCD